ncbi:MAG: Na+/H+ antiporter subunit E [Chloroflexi bacterium]|nr:Na+/H+ antiporter subunit E [Chloroflexota bacterium]
MIRLFASVLGLTAIYLIVLASFRPWDVVMGAVFSAALIWLTRGTGFGEASPSSDEPTRKDRGRMVRDREGAEAPGHPLAPSPRQPMQAIIAFLPFAAAVLRDIAAGTWQVALVVLHIRALPRTGIIAVPIEERTPTGVAVTSLVTTLSPGTFLVDVDWERRVMLFHVLDATDPETHRAAQRDFYERYQRHVFP